MESHEKLQKLIEKRQLELVEKFIELLNEYGVTFVNSQDGYLHIIPLKGGDYVKINLSDTEQMMNFVKNNI